MLPRLLQMLTLVCFLISPLTCHSQTSDETSRIQEATAEYLKGHYTRAEVLFREVLESSRRGENRDVTATVLGYLGDIYLNEERLQEANEFYNQALSMFRQGASNDVEMVSILRNLGALYSLQKKNHEATTVLNESLKIVKTHNIDRPQLVAEILNTSGIAYLQQGNFKKAEASLKVAMQMNSAAGAELNLSENLYSLALIYQKERKYNIADEFFQRAISISERLLGRGHPALALTRTSLGMLYTEMRRFDDAKDQYLLSLAITGQTDPIVDARVLRILYLLSLTYVQNGEKAEAEKVLARAAAIARRNHVYSETPTVLDAYSDVLKSTGKLQEAQSVHAEAKRVRAEMALTVRIKSND